MAPRHVLAGLVLFSMWLPGCETAETSARVVTETDTLSNGIVRTRSIPGATEVANVRPDPTFQIGVLEGDSTEEFGNIEAIAIDRGGRIYILDRRRTILRQYDSLGEHIRVIGRSGAGPGEFRLPIGLAIGIDGNLWAIDAGNARYTSFSSTGEVGSTFRRPLVGATLPWRGGMDVEGGIWDEGVVPGATGSGESGSIARITPGGEVNAVQSLPPLGGDRIEVIRSDGSRGMTIQQPFSARWIWRNSRGGRLWLARTDQYVFFQLTPAGDTVRIASVAAESPRVHPLERDSALQEMRNLISSRPTGSRVEGEPRIPERKPIIEDFIVSEGGELIVLLAGSRGSERRVDVLDSTGMYRRAVTVPEEFTMNGPVAAYGDFVYWVARDSLGVQMVQRIAMQ